MIDLKFHSSRSKKPRNLQHIAYIDPNSRDREIEYGEVEYYWDNEDEDSGETVSYNGEKKKNGYKLKMNVNGYTYERFFWANYSGFFEKLEELIENES